MKEQDLIFFKPLWRRVLVLVLCIIWAVIEWVTQQPFWGMVATAMALYCYWNFFHIWEDKDDEPTP